MARYSIEDTTLTALGDALRRKHGETKIITVTETVNVPTTKVIKCSETSTIEDCGRAEVIAKDYEVIDFTGATSIQVYYTVNATGGGVVFYKGRHTLDTINSEDKLFGVSKGTKQKEIFSYDVITVVYETVTKSQGYYIELTGLDENGNPISGDVEVTKEVEVLNTYSPLNMADAIDAIKEAVELPESAFNISGNCSYRFSCNGWNWFIEKYGDRVKTENITQCTNMFTNSDKLEEIPFIINTGNNTSFSYIFHYCEKLKTAPVIKKPEGVVTTGSSLTLSSFFENCYSLGTLPNDYFNNFITAEDWEKFKTASNQVSRIFSGCRVLREIPDLSNFSGKYASYSYSSSLYYYGFQNCYSLNKVTNLPVKDFDFSAFTSNAFGNCFSRCARLNRVTFQTNEDGTPVVTTWKNQSIDLTSEVGYTTNYYTYFKNAGITDDKEVKDDTTYQALKNDEDWWTKKDAYCRYNKTSALETISTLPDVSAGSGNTIKFRGNAGLNTDGGAINTMTEAEIAIAAAKGWTVTMV